VAVSGLVVRPAGSAPAGGWPVLSWAHGTTGSADLCAPSLAGVLGIPFLDRMLAAGYVVSATDYEGLGTPGPHPYLVGTSEGRSVLDAARAARRLVPEATGPVVTWGHSQGGQAALWAGELAPSYAPDLALAGVAAFAPAARQDGLLDRGDDAPDPFLAGFTVAAAAGLAVAHPELQVSDVLTDGALARIGVLETACIAQVLATFAFVPGGVLRPEAAGREDWRRAVDANQAGEQAGPVPVLVLQGEEDVLVRPASVERYRERACRTGIEVEVRLFPEADHTSIVDDGWEDAERWSADRLAGRPPQTC
jgi:pimeloyl-ACP methyl ester carboxylesterase